MLSARLICKELHTASQLHSNGVCASQAEGEDPHYGSQIQGRSHERPPSPWYNLWLKEQSFCQISQKLSEKGNGSLRLVLLNLQQNHLPKGRLHCFTEVDVRVRQMTLRIIDTWWLYLYIRLQTSK